MMPSCMRANSRFSFTQLFAVSSLLLFTIASHGNGSALGAESDQAGNADIKTLIRKAIAARDKATTSIPRARGKGSYRVTVIDKAMNVTYKERASFQMARSDPRQFFQFRYEEGAGHEDRDVYARVVVSDGETIVYESRFCQRIRPTGAEALAYKDFEPGSLQPCVWISGNLARYYSFGDRLLMEKDAKLSLRDEDGVQVVTVTEGGAAMEFWIDPRKDFHIVRYRLVLSPDTTPLVVTDVFREWKRQMNYGLFIVVWCATSPERAKRLFKQPKRNLYSTRSSQMSTFHAMYSLSTHLAYRIIRASGRVNRAGRSQSIPVIPNSIDPPSRKSSASCQPPCRLDRA